MTDKTFELTEAHLKLLRALVWFWAAGGENEVPMVYGYSTTDHSGGDLDNPAYLPADRYSDMVRILGLNINAARLSADDQSRLDNMHEELGQALEIFLEHAELAPGEYSYPNWIKHLPYPAMPSTFDIWDEYEYGGRKFRRRRATPMPAEDTLTVQFREEHLRLLRVLRIKWDRNFNSYYGVWEKRPYGDMTVPELDMAVTLGIAKLSSGGNELGFTQEQMEYLHKLHADLYFVLPVFLTYGKLVPGGYSL